jgi:class 3 adenylate cyclase
MQELAQRLHVAQKDVLAQAAVRQNLEGQLTQLKVELFPVLLAHTTQSLHVAGARVDQSTVLFLDLAQFSTCRETEQREQLDLLRGLVAPLFAQGCSSYMNTWGDAIVSCFADPNEGLTRACQVTAVLHSVGLHARIGMSYGATWIHYNPVRGCDDITGDSVNLAARLEPLADPGTVLIAAELRYHPGIDATRFCFIPQHRLLQKAIGEQHAGAAMTCYTVTLACPPRGG